MNRVSLVFVLCLTVGEAQDTPVPASAHAPLFRDKAIDAGVATQRVLAHAPAIHGDSGQVQRVSFIDDEIFGRMERDHVPHAALTTDREFVRRVTLDLRGRIPTPREVREFLADSSRDKRSRLIDRLIGSPSFVDKWAYYLMDQLRANGKMGRGHTLFHLSLKQSLAADRPYDDWIRDLIASSGKSNYVVASLNPIVREHVEGKPGETADGDDLSKVNQLDTHDELSILYSRLFLGINTSCISCHDGANHLEKVNTYLSTLTRSQFFQQSAFLGKSRYIPHVENSSAVMGHFFVDDSGAGYDTKAPSMLRTRRTGGPNQPAFLLTGETPRPDAEPRAELARMLTAHPQFARAAVNMFWSKLMGVGLVDPIDDFDLARLQEQASHPQLLEKLASYFRENDYSLHKLFRLICNSSAYQLSAHYGHEWNDKYTRYYARKFVRMLSAEELHDSIVVATERPGKFVVSPRKESQPETAVSMAMQVSVPQPRGELKSFMAAFGQSNRGAPPRPPSPSPLQPIMMMRSPVVNERVLAEKDSRVHRLLHSYEDDARVVEEIFLATLSREPLPEEKAVALEAMRKNRTEGAQNLQWALLNVAEFIYNF
jgi:hypothetical protein